MLLEAGDQGKECQDGQPVELLQEEIGGSRGPGQQLEVAPPGSQAEGQRHPEGEAAHLKEACRPRKAKAEAQ